MATFFIAHPYQRLNQKWMPQYTLVTENDGEKPAMQINMWDVEFDHREDANEYTRKRCLEEGHIESK